MFIERHQILVPMVLNLLLVYVCVTAPLVNGAESRKLDENPVPATNGNEKCVPCGSSSPPPPPPANPPPSPPPPSPKKTPPSQYCPPPPPPPSSFIYITGPPGSLYPVDENFNGAICRGGGFTAALPFLVGLLSLLAFW